MRLGLVGCSDRKRCVKCRAEDMYSPSDLFTKSYNYTKTHYDKIGIFSAKYGLLYPEDIIEPYNKSLLKMKVSERKKWAIDVYGQLIDKTGLKQGDVVYFHVGERYREYIIPRLLEKKIQANVPLQGLTFGRQLSWYKKNST